MQARNAASGSIPDGSNVKIIAIAFDSNGQLCSFNKSLTVNSIENIEVTMTSITDADLTAFLDGM